MYDLKLTYQKNRELNEGIDHLWGMKEVEYNNVNTIVGQIKQNFTYSNTLRNNTKNT